MIILARFGHRDGAIHCQGTLLDHRCAKIHRVCISSLSAECHAAVTAGDHAIWFQMILMELGTHRYDIQN